MAALKSLPASEWAYRSIGELAAALRDKHVSALELADQFIDRIEALDGDLNAVVVRDFERARAAAKAADAARARGAQEPLLGIPMTIKESFHLTGTPTTWGIPNFKGWQPQADALAVTRVKQAGAVILGKTNVPLGLGDWQSYNEIYGQTNNPWDKARSPGGSSGGSSAALAAGFGPLSLGSDIGGSLRVPAHFCGIYAHKPTYRLAASRGHLPPAMPEWLTGARDLAVIGPMACHAEDLEIALDIIAGPDETAEGKAYRLALPPARHAKLADFRVLMLTDHPLLPTDAPLRSALEALAHKLEKSGVDVKRDSPLLPDLAEAARVYMRLLNAVISAATPEQVHAETVKRAAALPATDRSLQAEILRGAVMSHREWLQTDFKRQQLKQQWHELFRTFDVVICPPAATAAFPHDHSPNEQRKLTINGAEFSYFSSLVWAESATSCGLPATVAPIGTTQLGHPVGVQIIGAEYEDRTTLAFARLLGGAFGGFVPPPGYGPAL